MLEQDKTSFQKYAMDTCSVLYTSGMRICSFHFLKSWLHMNLLVVFCSCLFSSVSPLWIFERATFCFLRCLQSSHKNFYVVFYGSVGNFDILKLPNWKFLVGLLVFIPYILLWWHILPPPMILVVWIIVRISCCSLEYKDPLYVGLVGKAELIPCLKRWSICWEHFVMEFLGDF